VNNYKDIISAGLIVEVADAFTLLSDEQLAKLKNRVLLHVRRLNGTSRGYYALDMCDLRRGRPEKIALHAVAEAIKDAFYLPYLPACGECD